MNLYLRAATTTTNVRAILIHVKRDIMLLISSVRSADISRRLRDRAFIADEISRERKSGGERSVE